MSDRIINLRRELHQFPEVSGQERNTKRIIKSYFADFIQPDETIELGETGLAFIIKGKSPGKRILFRCELDALPIQEENKINYRSTIPGISHVCGHDGHMATMCALAEKVKEHPPQKGDFIFLFQPAEENGAGAKEVLADENFIQVNPDIVIAYHNVPGFEKQQLLIRENYFTPNVISCIIKLNGKTSHAGEPENGNNPIFCLQELLRYVEPFTLGDEQRKTETKMAVPYVKGGEKSFGVSAGDAELGITLRSNNMTDYNKAKNDIEALVTDLCDKHDLNFDIEWFEEFLANFNHPEICKKIKQVAEKNNLPFKELDKPFPWGEDFGIFTQKFKGCLLGVGSGINHPALHNPDFDFPEELIYPTANFMFQLFDELQHD